MKGIHVDFVEFQADEDRVRLVLECVCDRRLPRHLPKTLTLDELDELIERLNAIRDFVRESRPQMLAAVTAPEPLPLIVEKVAGRYTPGSGV